MMRVLQVYKNILDNSVPAGDFQPKSHERRKKSGYVDSFSSKHRTGMHWDFKAPPVDTSP